MKQEITEGQNEKRIVYVLIVLGWLSYLATFPVIDLQDTSSNSAIAAGFICGLCALPLGSKLSDIISDMRSNEVRVPAQCHG